MPAFGEMIIVYDLLPEIAEKLDKALDEAVRKAAFDIQGKAQAIITANGQVDTGFMKNSVYVVTHDESTYNDVQAPEEGQELLPQVEKPKAHEAVIAVGASYGVYQEFGTMHQPARPYLTPAAEFVRPQFIHALEKMEDLMMAL